MYVTRVIKSLSTPDPPSLFPSFFPQVHDLKVELRTLKAGLHNTSQFILEPKELKEAVKELYRKHLHDYDQVGEGVTSLV